MSPTSSPGHAEARLGREGTGYFLSIRAVRYGYQVSTLAAQVEHEEGDLRGFVNKHGMKSNTYLRDLLLAQTLP